MNTSSKRERVVVRLFLTALMAIVLAGFFRFGISGPLASSPPPGASPSREAAVTTEQSFPMREASSGDDVGPGQAEPILVGAP